MEFEKYTEEQYRSLDATELDARREYVLEAFDGDTDTETLKEERDMLVAEYQRRNEKAQLRGIQLAEVASEAKVIERSAEQKEEVKAVEDIYATEEYERAFEDYVKRSAPIPEQFRADALTQVGMPAGSTADVQAVIPTVLANEIVRKMESRGEIWSRVRKTAFKGGYDIPVLDLKPVATWITADSGTSESYDQEIKANTKISFSYYGLECKVAQTLLVNTVTTAEFQSLFAELAVEAMVDALEAAIINGSGSGEFTGITTDSRIPAANTISMSQAQMESWSEWHKRVKAAMKKSYREGVFIMAQSTFDAYVDGMVDDNGQPIARVNYGIDGGETYRFMGREVLTVEDSLIADFDTASTDDVVALFVNLDDYAVNQNLPMTSARWIDYDTNTIKNKVIMIADGKLIDPNGVLIITKGAGA